MISVSEAIQHIEAHCQPFRAQKVSIFKAMDLVLAEDVVSPIHMPPFKQSSMDGYAFIHSDEKELVMIGEIQAGSAKNYPLQKGEAVRIFTGARIPDDADTVIMQEHTEVIDGKLQVKKLPAKHSNVRPLGEQIAKGEVALSKGTMLNEAAIGFLAGLGVAEVVVYIPPKVAIVITGNELKEIGESLENGQVYESNSITLKLALQKIGIQDIEIIKVQDALEETITSIGKAITRNDVILISGGISVGDYDFVKVALEKNKANEVFYKVNQKPGKPLWFGYSANKKIFALPGNPASSLSCFYVYVLPLLKAQMGHQNFHLPRKKAIAVDTIKNIHNKTLFLKGSVTNGRALQLKGQASSMLKSFAISNALLVVPEDVLSIQKGEELTYIEL